MSSSESRTTSFSDTTEGAEHPGHLTISGAPGRKGKYLYIERPGHLIGIARFMSDNAVDNFREWARAASEQGLKIQWKDADGEEGNSSTEA